MVTPLPSRLPPLTRTTLIGRHDELALAHRLLLDESVPLLTLTGPGGVGKTHLALAIAQQVTSSFANGTVFVDLSDVRGPEMVLPAMAQAFSLHERGSRPLSDILAIALKPQQVLLLLDNVEHVVVEAPAISTLLSVCPLLQILATSRVPLRLREEQLLPVPPLSLPPESGPSSTDLQASDAVALFVARAKPPIPRLP